MCSCSLHRGMLMNHIEAMMRLVAHMAHMPDRKTSKNPHLQYCAIPHAPALAFGRYAIPPNAPTCGNVGGRGTPP